MVLHALEWTLFNKPTIVFVLISYGNMIGKLISHISIAANIILFYYISILFFAKTAALVYKHRFVWGVLIYFSNQNDKENSYEKIKN